MTASYRKASRSTCNRTANKRTNLIPPRPRISRGSPEPRVDPNPMPRTSFQAPHQTTTPQSATPTSTQTLSDPCFAAVSSTERNRRPVELGREPRFAGFRRIEPRASTVAIDDSWSTRSSGAWLIPIAIGQRSAPRGDNGRDSQEKIQHQLSPSVSARQQPVRPDIGDAR